LPVQVPLSHQTDIAGFHGEATRLLAQQVPPHTVEWNPSAAGHAGEQGLEATRATIRNRAARAIIPQSFVRMSELVVLHRDPLRFDLLYRSLWRLVYEPELRHDFGDGDLARLRQMAQSVRRDIQKMKTRMTFETMTLKGKELRVGWYEPSHFVTEVVGAWLATHSQEGGWIVLTPDRSLRWDGEHLLTAPGIPPAQQPHMLTAAGWHDLLESLPWV
jgi:probable DNA metabolism protein